MRAVTAGTISRFEIGQFDELTLYIGHYDFIISVIYCVGKDENLY